MKIHDITRIYRQKEGEEDAVVSAEPEVTPEPDPPVDDGNDLIPEPNLWDALSKDEDDVDSPEVEDSPPPVVEEPEAPQPPVAEDPPTPAEPSAEPVAAKEDVVPPVVEPVAPEVQPTPVAPEPTVTPVEPTTAELAATDLKNREEMQAKISEHYKMTEEESLQLLSDPGVFLPKYQARMWTDMWYAMQTMLQQSMPSLIQNNLRQVEEQNSHVDDFFSAWPKLNKKDHGTTVAQVAKVYSQVNPNATTEEVTKFVGMQAMLHHGMSPDLAPVDPSAPAPVPAEPTPAPYQPAAVNAAPAAQRLNSDNVWAAMSEELDEEDSN